MALVPPDLMFTPNDHSDAIIEVPRDAVHYGDARQVVQKDADPDPGSVDSVVNTVQCDVVRSDPEAGGRAHVRDHWIGGQ